MQTVIMAGGKGTRISGVYKDVPKALIPVAGKPVMERQIERLKENGLTEIIVITGYLGEKIQERFGDGGAFGVNIEYIRETEPLGTAGGLFYLKGKVCEDFLLINCDLVFNLDIGRFAAFHKEKNAAVSLTAHPSGHPEDSALIDADCDGLVKSFIWKGLERPAQCKNLANAGIHMLSPEVLEGFSAPVKTDLDRLVINEYIKKGRAYAYVTDEYIIDMGTPERLKIAEDNIERGGWI